MELNTMHDSDVSSTLLEQDHHVEDLSLEDVGGLDHDDVTMPTLTTVVASTSPKSGSDLSWLRRLEREMDTKLLLDAEKINERIQRRKAHEEEMQQSLATFTSSGRLSTSSSAAAPSVHSSTKSSASSISNINMSTDSTNGPHRRVAPATQTHQPLDEWKEAFTEDGKKYFYNRRTRETSWTCPENAIVVNRSDVAAPKSMSTDFAVDTSTVAGVNPSPATLTMQQANKTMYCMFCGMQCRVWELMPHMTTCDLLRTHKEQRTAMYEEAVDIASELFVKQTSDADTQTSDRYLHYASVYSVYHGADNNGHDSSIEKPHGDPLVLLKQRRRHTLQPTTRDKSDRVEGSDDVMTMHVDLNTKLSLLRLKQTTDAAAQSRRQDAIEQCRYCHRSFAEGRLNKHEAVCPRVFGTETTWNNHHASKKDAVKQMAKPSTTKRPKAPHSTGGHLSKSSLAGSFLEYQATLVTCPCCQRKFAPSGAQQHIEICQNVENKPKKMVPKSFAIAG
ncbi:hypothetical protein H310_00425 [Aphanomyces invadans]|uniref:WW domain-containing protein n=1 Tax=Aphanomyces invadans TaxID=157072 RepID=A0A024UVP6_9STRA|nr:hypothetical protein H310_00425 [Aphanomyces invadans]ETW10025.1 hypothetical protein H310_00425 [Aphanomyces invadans]|eukprot:XP_008861436.1 hypothetical protein H310_00425 [Aphanomyces invadans]